MSVDVESLVCCVGGGITRGILGIVCRVPGAQMNKYILRE